MAQSNNNLEKLLKERMKEYEDLIHLLPLDESKKQQINVCFINFIKIIERLADKHLFLNTVTNITVIILSAIVPVLININTDRADAKQILILATIFSVALAILNGFRQSYKFNERWQNYRETAEHLILEGQSYFALSGKYSIFPTHDHAFSKFIENVNALRTKQIASYISQLMTVNDKEIAKSVTEEVKARLVEIDAVKIENAIAPIRLELMKIENVVSAPLIYENGIPILKVHVNDNFNTDNLIPNKVYYQGADNSQKEIAVSIVHDVNPTTHGLVAPGDEIANDNPYKNYSGSAGGRLYDSSTNEEYFITCYHVVKSPSHSWDPFIPNGNEIVNIIKDGSVRCGKIIKAFHDDKVDVAVIKLINNYRIQGAINGIGTPYFKRPPNPNDKIYQTKVKMYGAVSKFSVGFIADIEQLVKLTYKKVDSEDLEVHLIRDVIFVHALSDDTFSKPGDSGSFVVDEYNYLIGILLGGFKDTSYVIPIDSILDRTKTKLTRS
ncbi:DUF4231 domain-containing protein [Pedobacter sp. B4-66]|uniref:DUF4231 domain-containing protein n=1 Tax=Pedobacter sp. B4-66 TaxID=2817280 RepID=UPI001BDB5024|nr:DUF4231 domain-containing protein [Pedobacter sp. B4-66]